MREQNVGKPARVMVCEENPGVAGLLAERLARWGMRVVDDAPEVIVCGSGRPDEIERLASVHGEVPVLAVTDPSSAAARQLFDAGARAVLVRCPGYLEQLGPACAGLVCGARGITLARSLEEIRAENRTLRGLIGRLESLASTDALTGLSNRRAFEGQLGALFNAAQRYHTELSCLVIDVDRLKLVNDQLGHAAGDRLLRLAGEAIVRACRRSDVAARIGGDEFAVLLPHTPAAAAACVAHRIRGRFADLACDDATCLGDAGSLVGLSIGVSSLLAPGVHAGSDLIRVADEAMYADKVCRRETAAAQAA